MLDDLDQVSELAQIHETPSGSTEDKKILLSGNEFGMQTSFQKNSSSFGFPPFSVREFENDGAKKHDARRRVNQSQNR